MVQDKQPETPWADGSWDAPDIPGREDFVQAVATRIDQCPVGLASTVFGLVGPWGCGKTTLLRAIERQLNDWDIVWFSPWSAADSNSISTEFVSALAEAFPQKTVKKKLAQYARFGAPILSLVPLVGGVLSTLTREGATEVARRPAWHTEFKNISELLASQEKRVLMIVDDVDRLDPEELRSLLRVVRLLGRFTNVHYLMAYDQSTVDRTIGGDIGAASESNFMEKIVQYPFEVPPTPNVVRRRWSRAILEATHDSVASAKGIHAEYIEELVLILASGLQTPRSAERLRQQLISLSPLLDEAEIDMFDFIALTWLRISHHRIWDHIRLHPHEYLSWREDDPAETVSKRRHDISALASNEYAKPALDAVDYLFRNMGVTDLLAGRQGRIQDRRYFDRYFEVGISEDDVSERKVRSALEDLVNGRTDTPNSTYLRGVISVDDEEQASLALDTAAALRSVENQASAPLLEFLSDFHAALQAAEHTQSIKLSAVDRWLSREVFLALEDNLISTNTAIERFGYIFLASAVYYLSKRGSFHRVRLIGPSVEIAKFWTNEVRNEELPESIARKEMIQMSSFCIWVAEEEDLHGFLSAHITDIESLISAATAFVSFNEWIGGGTSYDIVFRKEEFIFAVGQSKVDLFIHELDEVPGAPSYNATDRSDRNLSTAERRDFAIRSLLSLRKPNEEG